MGCYSLRTIALPLAGFIAGITFVLACGESDVADAGMSVRSDAPLGLACENCEPRIDGERLYVIRRTGNGGAGGHVSSTATCHLVTDVAIGGGCWLYRDDARTYFSIPNGHRLLASGPPPRPPAAEGTSDRDISHAYGCVYENEGNDPDLIVVATAVCFRPHAQP
jgi:hypothetical protein